MEKRKISAKIVADSIDSRGNRLTSYVLTYPRYIHSELMTHRMFSRNAASSRAIPFDKMVNMIKEDPFIPIAWQKDHKGMQGTEYFEDPTEIKILETRWKINAQDAIWKAQQYSEDKVTKQICNRLLEPFMWYTVLVTATEYDNFFKLRCPKYEYLGEEFRSKKDTINSYTFDVGFEKERLYLTSLTELDWIKLSKSGAEIHIQALAEAMWDARNESTPKELKVGEWHIPFGDKIDDFKVFDYVANKTLIIYDKRKEKPLVEKFKTKIAVARCARLSYMTFEGEIDYEKDIKLHDQLLYSRHMSPFEHVARCMSNEEYQCFIKGYPIIGNEELANSVDVNENLFMNWLPTDKNEPNIHMGIQEGWCNNFRGFIPYRYLIENE